MRRATVRTDHRSETAAETVARALRPDNTDQMETAVEGEAVVTTVERSSTASLRATVDDYVVNLRTAAQLTDETNTTHDT
jgi:tRNA threonylcarbamoyladenosine modification (KEOPS) complex  Pcc1 subunit